MKKILLIDTANLMRRAIHMPFVAKTLAIEPTSNVGVYMLLTMISKLFKNHPNYEFYFVFEGSIQNKRETMPEYKTNRISVDDVSRQQIVKMMDILKYFPVNTVVSENHEADDIIYYLANKYTDSVEEIKIVSSDKDFIQMLQQFDNVKIFNPMKDEFRTLPEGLIGQYVHYKALAGDKADNIKNILGEKTSIKRANNIGFWLENVATESQKKRFAVNLKMVDFTMIDFTNVVIDENRWELNKEEIKNKLEEYKIPSILKKFEEWINTFESEKV